MTSTEPLPATADTNSDDAMLCHAWDIVHGKAGGDYIYSLQEDYIYIYKNHVWVRIFEKEFIDRVQTHLSRVRGLPLNRRKEVMENFKIKKSMRIEEFNKTPLINFENCMFDPTTLQQKEHDKKHYSTIRIPYQYDPEAKCPLWIKILEEILEKNKDKMELLQEFFGYCLVPDNEQKKGLLLLGETDTGKSTILDILRELIGDVNISSVPLQHLSNPQYTPLLINKMINLDPDVNKNAADYEREFKIITGGKNEKVSCNQKHIPTFEFVPKCKIILAANEFPKITDHSSAFYQRLLIVPCERRFQEHEKDRTIHDKLMKELPGIFNWVVEGLRRLKSRGSFKKYDFIINAVDELESENNPSNLFFQEHIEISMGSYILKSDLYTKYKQWSETTKNYALSENRFSSAVYKKFINQTPKNTRLDGGGKRIWRNIVYVDFKIHHPEPQKEHIEEETF